MSDTDFIAKTPALLKSQDFVALRSEGLERIEALAHELWTDYNVHDPGITLLELFCYGITELGYRTGYDVADLLTEIRGGVPVNDSDFHTARQVLTNHPVSFDDLRKLLIDVPGVRGAWIERHLSVSYFLDRVAERLSDTPTPTSDTIEVNGLYDVFIDYEDDVEPERRVYAGLPEPPAGGFINAIVARGIRFDVDYPLTLVAVHVIPEAQGRVTVRLEDAGGSVLAEKVAASVPLAGEKNRVDLGFVVPPGTDYRLRATADVRLYRTPAADADYPYSVERLVHLVGGAGGGGYFFFYDWHLSYAVPAIGDAGGAGSSPPIEPPPTAVLTRDDVRLAVVDRLHRSRCLCQDFVNVCDLEKQRVALCADLELAPGANVEEALAEIFYRLELHVSPPVRFYSIDDLRARGKTVEEIFKGPALDHGFIDDDEFRAVQRRCEVRVSDVVHILMDAPGVEAVKSISLLLFGPSDSGEEGCGQPLDQQDWILPLGDGRLQAPDFSPECSKVVFYKNDLPYFANRDTVAELLAEKRTADLATRLTGHEKDLPVPAGEAKDLETYEPLQNELPVAYGVGRVRVPESRPEKRKAQARQLKAYLLFFEQLLANHLSQLAHVRQLFSWSEEGSATYFTQELTGIAGLDEVYLQDFIAAEYGSLKAGLEAIVEDPETAAERRNRFLEHLAARFGESFTEYDLLMRSLLKGGALARLIAGKRALLADIPRVAGERGLGRDLRRPFPGGEHGVSGFARRVYRLLGFRPVTARRLANRRFRVVPGVADPNAWRFVLEAETGGNLFESIECEEENAVEVLLDAGFELGSDRANYRWQGGVWELVLECPGEEPRKLGATTSPGALGEVALAFLRDWEAEGFREFEHLLFRRRTTADPYLPVQLDEAGRCDCVVVEDPYSFRASVLLPAWSRRFQDVKFRRFVEDCLRRETPAHVFLKICWISHRQMRELEDCAEEWTRQLALLTEGLGRCRETDDVPPALTGELPLPPAGPEHQPYAGALAALIDKLHNLVTVHPLARLHDCRETSGDAPQITLNNTSLGTF